MSWPVRLAVVLAASCGPVGLQASNYSQQCSVSSDCTAIFSGDPCGCACPNEAINVADKARYDADARAATARCSPFRAQCLADCINQTPVCQAGRCVLQRASQ
ncbi:MAG: hypothetical protein JNJ54_31765 [Myxococcaceae bacterium]|nr:hypothetical protein [Myxococcaceae bacterium]